MSSVVERDFIERMIRQLAEALARALGLRRREQYDEAVQELHGAYPGLFGLEAGPLLMLDSTSAAELLGDPWRIRAFAQLLDEEAQLRALQRDEGLAAYRRQHALELYL